MVSSTFLLEYIFKIDYKTPDKPILGVEYPNLRPSFITSIFYYI